MLLAQAIRTVDPQAKFEGIGADRMRAAGFAIWRDHTGWASMGPLAAIPRIPKLLATMWRTAFHIAASKPDLVILGRFRRLQFASGESCAGCDYAGPILDVFPPATWLDNQKKARAVAAVAVPLTAFAHQSEFYRKPRVPIAYFGHPLDGEYPQPAAAPGAAGSTAARLRFFRAAAAASCATTCRS